MELGIRGKTALVTGSSAGIGRAIACELAEHGANVVLVARGKERLEKAADDIARRSGSRTLAFRRTSRSNPNLGASSNAPSRNSAGWTSSSITQVVRKPAGCYR